MRMPNCTDIVSTKNLWKIAIEFISCVDNDLMEYNLKLAYIVYLLCKAEGVSAKNTKRMVFLACFNDIGKLNVANTNSNATVETYLFLKYFSPLKEFAEVLVDNSNRRKIRNSKRFYICRKYTTNLVEQNDKDQAFFCLDKRDYDPYDFKKLYKVVTKNDLKYELNSMHYKTIIYNLISSMIFKSKERDELIAMLSSLFEMYSVQTLYHSKITALIAYTIAKKMHVGKIDCAKTYIAALCHDLGKVMIPLEILEKPGKLTDDEYLVMKKHVTYTRELLSHNMDFDIIEIAARHHEKIDGSGYPNHVDGDHMTKCQKVLQVSDIISALLAKRSYKEAWSLEKTMSILESEVKNKHIDGTALETFKENQRKILKLSENYTQKADKVYAKIEKERDYLINKRHLTYIR